MPNCPLGHSWHSAEHFQELFQMTLVWVNTSRFAKEVPARRSGPEAKQVSWTRSQNQSTNAKKKNWLPPQSACELACALQLAQFYEPVISPYAGNDASTQSQTFEKIFPSRFHSTRQSNRWRELIGVPVSSRFQSWDSNISLWPLARIRRPENATSMYVPKTIPLYQVTSFHWAFSEQTCTRCEDGLPWIMLIWRLMWEKRSTSDSVIYVIIICTEGSVFATGLSENVSKWSSRAHWKSGIILSYSTFLATSSRQVRESCTLLCPICLAWHWVQATSVAMGYKYEMLQQ